MKKPFWLNKKINLEDCRKVKKTLRGLNLHTVCEESLCPNISECFHDGVATFMILGDICTRSCSFCGTKKGIPFAVDWDEPKRIREAVGRMNLNYIVLTSPTRDDLDDGGAEVFFQTVKEIKKINGNKRVEILIPDFSGNKQALEKIACCGADVIAHNIEVVPSLYIKVRKEGNYERSLHVLNFIKGINKNIFTKTGIMLGLGETEKEIIDVLYDLCKIQCDFLTIGQYLSPSLKHFPVQEYVTMKKFIDYKEQALKIGFKEVKSAPYIRSSYRAHTVSSYFFSDRATL